MSWARADSEEYLDHLATNLMTMTRYGRLSLSEAMALPRRWQKRFGTVLDKMLSEEGGMPEGG